MAVIPHPPYSPDLATCDFFLFPELKLKVEGGRFDTIEEIQSESQRVLDSVTENDFLEAFQKWRRRPIVLMMKFMIFTASVRNSLDTPSNVKSKR
jgi:hypothetical protein